MTTLLVALLVLAGIMLATPRGARSRAEIRAAARSAGWKAVAPAGRHLVVQVLLLLVESLRVVTHLAVFLAQVLVLAADLLETPRETA